MTRSDQDAPGTSGERAVEGELGSRFVEVGDGRLFLSEVQVALSPEMVIDQLTTEFGRAEDREHGGRRSWLVPTAQMHRSDGEPARMYRISLATEKVEHGTRARIAVGAATGEGMLGDGDAELDEIEIIVERLVRTLGLPMPEVAEYETEPGLDSTGSSEDGAEILAATFAQHRYLQVIAVGGVATLVVFSAIAGNLPQIIVTLTVLGFVGAGRWLKGRR